MNIKIGRRVTYYGTLLLLACSVGCAGSSQSASSVASSAAAAACNGAVNLVVGLSYPIAGATAVPTSLGRLVFAVQSGDGRVLQAQLIAQNGAVVSGSTLGPPPSPLPSPIASLSPNSFYAGATVAALSSATAYTVRLNNLSGGSGGCGAQSMDVGTFTTQ